MKNIALLLLLFTTTQSLAQTTLPLKLDGTGRQGRGKLIRQPDGKLIYATSAGGNFYTGRLFTNGDTDDAFSGLHTSKVKLKHLIYCKTLTAELDKWNRLLVAGSSCIDSNSGNVATLTRLTKNGAPDPDFLPGVIQLKVGDSSEFNAVYVQPDEKIMGVGSCYTNGAYHVFFARFIYNGEKDAAFGKDGISIDNSLPGNNKVVGIAVQPDGKVVVAGSNTTESLRNLVLARFNADGTPDTTFGSHGLVLSAAADNDYFLPKNMVLQPDGKILVSGTCGGANGGQDIFISRYNAGGSPDTSFNKTGTLKSDITFTDRADDLALTTDNRILTSGAGANKGERKFSRYLMLRVNADGTTDKKYGYGAAKGMSAYVVKKGYAALSHHIAVAPRDGRIYRLSELVSSNETEIILALTTFLHDTSLSIIDIPDRKFQSMIYPEPITKPVTFSFDLIDEQKTTIKLLDATGKELAVIANNKLYAEGENTFTLSIPSSAHPGNYEVVITTAEGYKAIIEVAKM